MLNWDKINAKLEKEKIIIWGRRKEIDEDGNEITIDYVFTELWGLMTKELSSKTLGILYARFNMLPNDDELLSVRVTYFNKNDFKTEGAQIIVDKYLIDYFDKEFECVLKDTLLLYMSEANIDYKIFENANAEKFEYVFFQSDLFDLIKYTEDINILKASKDFYIISDDTDDKMLFIRTEPRILPEYLK